METGLENRGNEEMLDEALKAINKDFRDYLGSFGVAFDANGLCLTANTGQKFYGQTAEELWKAVAETWLNDPKSDKGVARPINPPVHQPNFKVTTILPSDNRITINKKIRSAGSKLSPKEEDIRWKLAGIGKGKWNE